MPQASKQSLLASASIVIVFVLVFLALAYRIYYEITISLDLIHADWMFISGLLVMMTTVILALFPEPWFKFCMEKLCNSGIILTPGITVDHIQAAGFHYSNKHWRAPAWQFLVLELVIGALYFHVSSQPGFAPPPLQPGSLVISVLSFVLVVVIVAYQMSVIISLNNVGSILDEASIHWQLLLHHPDKLGGTAYVGYQLAYSAVLCLIPLVWTTFWFLAQPNWDRLFSTDYSVWKPVLAMTVAFCVGSLVVTVLLPLYRFHRIMKQKKNLFAAHLDALREQLRDLRADSPPNMSIASVERLAGRIAKEIDTIQNAPTWPIRARTAVLWVIPHLANIILATVTIKNLEVWFLKVL